MKKLILFSLISLFSTFVKAQSNSYQLSSHILDVSLGALASGVTIKLEKLDTPEEKWVFVAEKVTDQNGRITDFLNIDTQNQGIYKLTYYTKPYFQRQGIQSFYPFIEVVFEISDDSHYHVPITLSAFGYATYRGN
jgi:5-hydroxyisourate hydrolase